MIEKPERKSPTEQLDIQRKTEDIVSGKRPVDVLYPYIPPDYKVPFLHIGTEKQLFLDNHILDRLDGVTRVFSKPDRPDEPIIKTMELPWELRGGIFPVSAVQDPDDNKFKLWYVKDRTRALCYAEADDPLHWEKPLSEKCLPFEDHKATNIVLDNSGHHVALALNYDQSDKERKFLMINNPGDVSRGPEKKTVFRVSADGLQWTTVNENTPYQHHHYQRPIWDESIQKWISYSQYSHHWNMLHRKRQIGRQESPDFMHWSPKEVVLSVDWEPNLPPHLEFHDMSVRKVGGQYIGVATEFMAEPILCAPGDWNWHDHAYAHLSLYASRDGKHWRRAGDDGPWADRGRPGSYDYGFLNDSVAGQLVHDGKTFIVYGARPEKQRPNNTMAPEENYRQASANRGELVDALGTYPRVNACSVGILFLREDGWAELKPSYEQGKATTRQFVFEGDTLRLNAEAYGGYIRVEVLDPQFKPYEGFSAEDCDPVYSDDPAQIWHTVRWNGSSDVRSLWNKPVRVVFHLHQASLYAFQFEYSDENE